MLRKLLILWLLTSTAVIYAESLVVGNIEDLACPSKYYALNETFPVKILMDLHTGDKLTLTENKSLSSACREKITSETRVLSVNLNGKSNQAIKYSELPYTVPAGSTITTTSDNLLSQLSSWFTEQNDEQLKQQKRLVGLTSKTGGDEKPRIAVLGGDQQRLVAGERELFVAWQFGTPPFTVKINDNREERTLFNSKLEQLQFQQRLKLVPGTYSLSIEDVHQQAVKYTFTVVPELPSIVLSQELSNSIANDELTRLIAQALCLATQDKGIWRFEVIQQITPHVEKYAPARILREALLQGAEISILNLTEKDCNN